MLTLWFSTTIFWTWDVDMSNAANHGLSKLQEGRALKPIADKKYVAHQLSGLIEEYIRDCKKVGTDELNMAMIETTLGIFAKWLKEYK